MSTIHRKEAEGGFRAGKRIFDFSVILRELARGGVGEVFQDVPTHVVAIPPYLGGMGLDVPCQEPAVHLAC